MAGSDRRALRRRERAVEMGHGLSRGGQRARRAASASGVFAARCPVRRFPGVVGERLDDAVGAHCALLPLERRRHLTVQRNPLASEELRIDGLPRQRMAEREPLGRPSTTSCAAISSFTSASSSFSS